MNDDDDGLVRLPAGVVEEGAWLIGIIEDWLLHASSDTFNDLATFAGGGPFTRPADTHARIIANRLGEFHHYLLRSLRNAGIDT